MVVNGHLNVDFSGLDFDVTVITDSALEVLGGDDTDDSLLED